MKKGNIKSAVLLAVVSLVLVTGCGNKAQEAVWMPRMALPADIAVAPAVVPASSAAAPEVNPVASAMARV